MHRHGRCMHHLPVTVLNLACECESYMHEIEHRRIEDIYGITYFYDVNRFRVD